MGTWEQAKAQETKRFMCSGTTRDRPPVAKAGGGKDDVMRYDAVKVAEARNKLAQHQRTCNRCFQGVHCPEKERLQADIEHLRNAWKENGNE